MGALFIYILKSSVCLILFYLFFRLLLSKETFHRFNRIALLGVLFLSLVLPWIEVTTTHQAEVHQTFLTIEQLVMMAEVDAAPTEVVEAAVEVTPVSWIQVILLLYLVGIIVFACRSLYSLSCLLRLVHCGKREKMAEGIILVVHEQAVAPFSWMKYIVISRKDIEENGREILIHETAHIRNRHSIDLLIADICIFFQWFNPGAWLLKQELRNIHEYEADETVIRKGVNAKEYQLLLIRKAVGTRLYSMANSFNHSKLKKRITMMLKEKSSPWARLKYLYVLPLAAIAVTAFARPEVSEKAEEISVVKVNDLAAIVETKVEKMRKDIFEESKTVSPRPNKPVAYVADSLKISGRYVYSILCDIRDDEELIVIDGKEMVGDDPLSKIVPGSIEGISMLKKRDALEAYGEKGKDGVVVITTKKSVDVQEKRNNQKETTLNEMKIIQNDSGKNVGIKGQINWRLGDKEPLFVIDNREASHAEFMKIPNIRTNSVTILKNNAATSAYGRKGKNGVILITLLTDEEYAARKNALEKSPHATALTMTVAKMNGAIGQMVFIVDHKEVSREELKLIPAKDIQNLVVMNGSAGKTIFEFETVK